MTGHYLKTQYIFDLASTIDDFRQNSSQGRQKSDLASTLSTLIDTVVSFTGYKNDEELARALPLFSEACNAMRRCFLHQDTKKAHVDVLELQIGCKIVTVVKGGLLQIQKATKGDFVPSKFWHLWIVSFSLSLF